MNGYSMSSLLTISAYRGRFEMSGAKQFFALKSKVADGQRKMPSA